MEMHGFVGRLLAMVYRIWTFPLLRFGVRGDQFQLEFFPSRAAGPALDERIAQIDIARENLKAALSAVDELKATAEKNRQDINSALGRLKQVHHDKAAAEKELLNVKQIAEADIDVFRKLAGVPSRRGIARERFIGLIIGIVASFLASLIWWLCVR